MFFFFKPNTIKLTISLLRLEYKHIRVYIALMEVIMIKTVSALIFVSFLSGCAVYSDAPYVNTYSSGIYANDGVIIRSSPVIVDTYPVYPARPYYTPRYHAPHYQVRPGYRPPPRNRLDSYHGPRSSIAAPSGNNRPRPNGPPQRRENRN